MTKPGYKRVTRRRAVCRSLAPLYRRDPKALILRRGRNRALQVRDAVQWDGMAERIVISEHDLMFDYHGPMELSRITLTLEEAGLVTEWFCREHPVGLK